MRAEIEKSMEAQKRQKPIPKIPEKKKVDIVEENPKTEFEEKKLPMIKTEEKIVNISNHEENKTVIEKELEKTTFDTNLSKVNETVQEKHEIIEKRAESPKPAPPVIDDNFESEVFYDKEERLAKEKQALEIAQNLALEQKNREEKEIGEKKQALNQLENKFEDIASKYLKK